jgi:hypothetical protein
VARAASLNAWVESGMEASRVFVSTGTLAVRFLSFPGLAYPLA